ncbi:MAG: hypothetical protein PF569_07880 [Candidatus Woesearchaeota archaeon]|jgi:prolyl-tRNA synthetase|nr:hypothetical protein [Candidatus Woesearchaeota archaeon]
MKLSNLPHSSNLKVPKDFKTKNTSDLIENFIFSFYKEPGLPYHSPIGEMIFSRIRDIIVEEHLRFGASKIKIPGFMRRGVLDNGEPIAETFAKKFIMLPQPMNNYMVMTTPEMEVLDYLNQCEYSYRNLPIKLFYMNQILRPIKKPKGTLKSREFEVAMMLSLDNNREDLGKSLQEYELISENIFDRLKIPIRKVLNLNFDLEYFYEASEGDNLELGDNERVKALSLSMGYEYKPKDGLVKVRSRENNKIRPKILTYGLGIERCFYCALDSARDDLGFSFPEQIRPFELAIISLDSKDKLELELGDKIYQQLKKTNSKVYLDNRCGISKKEKYSLTEFLGVPNKISLLGNKISVSNRENTFVTSFNSLEDLMNHLQ